MSQPRFRSFWRLLPLALCLMFAALARADYNPIAITTNSYNADMIIEKGASNLVFNNYTTATLEQGTNNAGSTLFEFGYFVGQSNATVGDTPGIGPIPNFAAGIPPHGSTFSSQDASGRLWQMPPDYTQNNTILVYSGIPSATFTISSNAGPFNTISFLDTGSNAVTTIVTVIINHVGGGSETNTVTVSDRLGTGAVADYVHAQVFTASNAMPTLNNISVAAGGGPRLLYNDVALSDTVNPITSITLQSTNLGRSLFFAVSGFNGSTWVPMGINGFNRDTIVEATAVHGGCLLNKTSVVMDSGGTNDFGNTWYEKGFNPNNPLTGIPVHGTTFTSGNATYLMPPDYTTNCVLFIGAHIPSGTLTFSNPAPNLTGLSILSAAGNGPCVMSYTINHQNDAPETGSISVVDWFAATTNITGANGASNAIYSAAGRFQVDVAGFNTVTNTHPTTSPPVIHTNDIPVTDPDPVVSVSFSYTSGGRVHIFAISTTTNGVNYAANGIYGWNADGVLEASAIWPFFTLGAGPATIIGTGRTTATMDGGVANTGATWFEQGTDRAFPNSGFPPGGSTITSLNLPDHHYTFAPDYTAKNAIFIDRTNFPTASIAIQPPYSTYSAFSFLSAAANGGTTNQIILQHLDGTSETNIFVTPDWFNNTPYAFTPNGRLNENYSGINNDANNPPNPRLYEAQFALNNIGSPVTNFILNYLSSVTVANSNTARSAIFAVSATAGAVAPILGAVTPATFTGLEGTNVSWICPVTGGSTNNLGVRWIYSPDQVTWSPIANGTNLAIGGIFSNATTTNLTLLGALYTDTGFYSMIATNITGGAITSGVAQITIYSGLPNVFTPGDPIVTYNPNNPNGGDSPAAETVDHAIDNLVGNDPGKYLNYGSAGTHNPPYGGPTGFIATPSKGSTVVNVLRIFTANDTQGRDPADVEVDGSNDGGNTWTVILPDTPIALPAGRNAAASAPANPLTQVMTEMHFANTNGYTTYRWFCNNVETPATVNSMQVGEVQLLGVLNPTLPVFTLQPPASVTNFVGSSPTLQVAVTGYPSNFTYQWYQAPSTPLAGKTTTTLQLNNVQLSDSGSQYYCAVSNSIGVTNSTTATLTVISSPGGAYVSTILADSPIAYFRLDEPEQGGGDNGLVANDYVGAHSGYYSNVVLGVSPGYSTHDSDTAVQVGQFAASASYVAGINGINMASPSNSPKSFSVEAWASGFFGLVQEPAGAGVVAKGYGGGGEQFAIDTGGTANLAFRFFIRDAGGASHPVSASSTNNTVDGLWHHLVGVCDEVNSNVSIYVDGALSGRITLSPNSGILGTNPAVVYPMAIGSRSALNGGPYTNQFIGNIDEVAIYNYALSSNQVLAHYEASQIPPYFSTVPTNATVSENASVTFTSFAPGTQPVTYQWFVSVNGGATFSAISGATNASYTITNVSFSANNNQYEVTAHNTYGTVTSPTATLTVVQTLALEQDVQSSYLGYPGGTLQLSVQFAGSLPITYGWWYNGAPLPNGGHYSGVNSNVLTISAIVASNAGTYQLFATNSHGTASSGLANVSLLPSIVTFFGSGSNWSPHANYAAAPISNNVIQTTDGVGGSEVYAAWFNSPLYIGGFVATYTYQEFPVPPATGSADGTCFVIQNDPRGTAAIGANGGNLGFVGGAGVGINPGAAVAWNIYAGNPIGGIGMEFLLNGAHGTVFPTAPLSVTSTDPIGMSLKYLNGVLSVTATDAVAATSFSTNVSLDLPGIMGTNAAYVGFTGADGGTISVQTVSNFTFTPIVGLATQVVGNSLVLSWPAGSGGYVLQQSPALNPSSWSNSGATVTPVNGFNTVTVPISAAAQFYRLNLAPGQ